MHAISAFEITSWNDTPLDEITDGHTLDLLVAHRQPGWFDRLGARSLGRRVMPAPIIDRHMESDRIARSMRKNPTLTG